MVDDLDDVEGNQHKIVAVERAHVVEAPPSLRFFGGYPPLRFLSLPPGVFVPRFAGCLGSFHIGKGRVAISVNGLFSRGNEIVYAFEVEVLKTM